MPEFHRIAAILGELNTMSDEDTERHAGIVFTTEDGAGICRILRATIAEQYREGNLEWQDRFHVAGAVGQDMADRADTLAWFATISDILALTTATSPDTDTVFVADGGSLGESVVDALRVRFTRAAYALITYLEQDADEKQFGYTDNPDGDGESGQPDDYEDDYRERRD